MSCPAVIIYKGSTYVGKNLGLKCLVMGVLDTMLFRLFYVYRYQFWATEQRGVF
jgi:hypothetical protein